MRGCAKWVLAHCGQCSMCAGSPRQHLPGLWNPPRGTFQGGERLGGTSSTAAHAWAERSLLQRAPLTAAPYLALGCWTPGGPSRRAEGVEIHV